MNFARHKDPSYRLTQIASDIRAYLCFDKTYPIVANYEQYSQEMNHAWYY
jgi:hypothetical protein